VVSRDPLAPRLSSDERVRRLNANFDSASESLQECVSKTQGDENALALQDLLMEFTDHRKTHYKAADLKRDADGFRSGLHQIYQIELQTEQVCHEYSLTHRALLLIAQRNGVAEQ
jgi:hypothetical protein